MSSSLKAELANLELNLATTYTFMSELAEEFWDNGGVCCPSCGVPGYSELLLKQERREARIAQIKKKLGDHR